MIQTGDPTGTGKGGESIFGYPFKDEFHSRLNFTHRGLVAMANSGKPNDNGSQFFITLNECQWLNEKHTIFGKITGDTIYNVNAIGEVDTDDNDRPTERIPKIIKTEVTVNPFPNIVSCFDNLQSANKQKKVQKSENSAEGNQAFLKVF